MTSLKQPVEQLSAQMAGAGLLVLLALPAVPGAIEPFIGGSDVAGDDRVLLGCVRALGHPHKIHGTTAKTVRIGESAIE